VDSYLAGLDPATLCPAYQSITDDAAWALCKRDRLRTKPASAKHVKSKGMRQSPKKKTGQGPASQKEDDMANSLNMKELRLGSAKDSTASPSKESRGSTGKKAALPSASSKISGSRRADTISKEVISNLFTPASPPVLKGSPIKVAPGRKKLPSQSPSPTMGAGIVRNSTGTGTIEQDRSEQSGPVDASTRPESNCTSNTFVEQSPAVDTQNLPTAVSVTAAVDSPVVPAVDTSASVGTAPPNEQLIIPAAAMAEDSQDLRAEEPATEASAGSADSHEATTGAEVAMEVTGADINPDTDASDNGQAAETTPTENDDSPSSSQQASVAKMLTFWQPYIDW
jgi:hypothetical protein